MSEDPKLQRLIVLDGQIRALLDAERKALERGHQTGWLLEVVMTLETKPELRSLLEEFKKLNGELYPPLRSVRPTSQNDLNKN